MTAVMNDGPATKVQSPAELRRKHDQRRALALLSPGILWMLLFMILPMCMVIYVSFWTQTTFAVEPTLTTSSWERFLGTETYLAAITTTLKIWAIVLIATLVVGSLLGLTVFLLDWFKESTGWSVNFMLAAFYLFVISSGVLVAVSLLRPSPADHPGRGLVWNNPLEALRGPAWRGIGNYRFLAALLFVTMVALYVVFS